MNEFGLQRSFVELCSFLKASVISNCVSHKQGRDSKETPSKMLGRAGLKRCRPSAYWKWAEGEGGLYFKELKGHIEFSSLGHCFLQEVWSESELRFLTKLHNF